MPLPKEVIYTNEAVVSCQGSTGGLGHPRVFLTIGESDKVVCPYCSRTFLMKEDASAATNKV